MSIYSDNRKKYCVHNYHLARNCGHAKSIKSSLERMEQKTRIEAEYNKTLRLLDLTSRNQNKKEKREGS